MVPNAPGACWAQVIVLENNISRNYTDVSCPQLVDNPVDNS
ncbi:hypothetical protein HMPREF9622_01815 [Cutibacterium modestum HL037PA3]|uniref:Uncharacterized protein n=1 Tax=Cutibacterium modestum HL044PA1 TaxID=765109 RepID=A0ABN0C653_9ACTN|nr:hypothetical protein HMPREF9621_01399 [Cutibacterium modestum HL037PA2]EFS92761.1 hypothetical protein HMPREF9607_00974 [Cutibacterium modestum HL044PA1]EFT15177.1 hypothetical protein HMPREF9622_01815 [Cutibacterium modestum HL037PA3]